MTWTSVAFVALIFLVLGLGTYGATSVIKLPIKILWLHLWGWDSSDLRDLPDKWAGLATWCDENGEAGAADSVRLCRDDLASALADAPRGRVLPRTARDMYRGAVRSVPVLLGSLVGAADLVALLAGADLEVWGIWPAGTAPLLGVVLGAGAGGLAIRIHDAVGGSLAAGIGGLWVALATRLSGQPSVPTADYDQMVRPGPTEEPGTLDATEVSTTLTADTVEEPPPGWGE